MPTTQEFTLIVDQNTILFIGFVVRLFLGLVMGLAFMFGFVVVALYYSGKLLIFGYSMILMITSKAIKSQRKEDEVLS